VGLGTAEPWAMQPLVEPHGTSLSEYGSKIRVLAFIKYLFHAVGVLRAVSRSARDAACVVGVGRRSEGAWSGARGERGRWSPQVGDELEQLSDVVWLLHRGAKRPLSVDLVVVPPAVACPLYVAFLHEVGHDGLGGTLGDPHSGSDVAPTDAGIAGDADQNMTVIGQECPAVPGRLARSTNRRCHVINVAGLVKPTTELGSGPGEPELAPGIKCDVDFV